METNTMRCRQCQGEMALLPLGRIDGEEHGVHLEIDGMPTLQCSKGHRQFAAPAFASELLDALLTDERLNTLDTAAQKGLLRKRYCCSHCGRVLAADEAGRFAAHRTLRLQELQSFDVRLELPTYRCPGCGRESVEPRDEMVDHLMKASARAFRSAEVAPA